MKFPHNITCLLLCAGLVASSTTAIANEQAKYAEPGFILTSIKPLQLIAADINQGVIKSVSLLPAGASPHAYALRPSQMKKIHKASAIYWVDPLLESFVKKSFNQYADKNYALAALTADRAPSTINHAQESSEEHALHSALEEADTHTDSNHQDEHALEDHDNEQAAHQESDEAEHNHQHSPVIHQHKYQGKDLHIWLSPTKALQIAKIMQLKSSELFPQHKALLAANYLRFEKNINDLDFKLNAQFNTLKGLGFLVFHDGYSRFVEHYQLNQLSALTINPAKRPGAKHLAQLRDVLNEDKPVCIFSEPQFSPAAVKTLVRNYPINIAELDPLATEINVDEDRYATFMRHFSQQFIDCLGQ